MFNDIINWIFIDNVFILAVLNGPIVKTDGDFAWNRPVSGANTYGRKE